MSSTDRPVTVERVLLAAGTSVLRLAGLSPLSTEAPRSVWASSSRTLDDLGFNVVVQPPGYRLDPALAKLRTEVRKAAAAAPVVVVYYTGHGADLEHGPYYLVNKKSLPRNHGRVSPRRARSAGIAHPSPMTKAGLLRATSPRCWSSLTAAIPAQPG